MPGTQAKYTVVIPTKDNLGHDLGDIATAAHHWLWQASGNKGSSIKGPYKGNWGDWPQEDNHHLETIAPDTPEMDSHVKQLAHEVARGANQVAIYVMKEGKQGIQGWEVDNPAYQEGIPSEIGRLVAERQPPAQSL
jgi:hypothetical protein